MDVYVYVSFLHSVAPKTLPTPRYFVFIFKILYFYISRFYYMYVDTIKWTAPIVWDSQNQFRAVQALDSLVECIYESYIE